MKLLFARKFEKKKSIFKKISIAELIEIK